MSIVSRAYEDTLGDKVTASEYYGLSNGNGLKVQKDEVQGRDSLLIISAKLEKKRLVITYIK